MYFPLLKSICLLVLLSLAREIYCYPAAGADPVRPSHDRPNAVFILADDLGYMDIGANNPKAI